MGEAGPALALSLLASRDESTGVPRSSSSPGLPSVRNAAAAAGADDSARATLASASSTEAVTAPLGPAVGSVRPIGGGNRPAGCSSTAPPGWRIRPGTPVGCEASSSTAPGGGGVGRCFGLLPREVWHEPAADGALPASSHPGGGGVFDGVLCSDIDENVRSMSKMRSSIGMRPMDGCTASSGGSSQKALTAQPSLVENTEAFRMLKPRLDSSDVITPSEPTRFRCTTWKRVCFPAMFHLPTTAATSDSIS